jgi:hypothetical protein
VKAIDHERERDGDRVLAKEGSLPPTTDTIDRSAYDKWWQTPGRGNPRYVLHAGDPRARFGKF